MCDIYVYKCAMWNLQKNLRRFYLTLQFRIIAFQRSLNRQ